MVLRLVVKNSNLGVSKEVVLSAGQHLKIVKGDAVELLGRQDIKVVRNGKNAVIRTAKGDEFVLEGFYDESAASSNSTSHSLSWTDASGNAGYMAGAELSGNAQYAENDTGTKTDAATSAAQDSTAATSTSSAATGTSATVGGLSGWAVAGLAGLGVAGVAAVASGGGSSSGGGATAVTADTTPPSAPAVPTSTGTATTTGVPVTVSLASTGAVAGDVVTVTVDGVVTNYTLTATDITAGTVTVTASAQGAAVGSPVNVTAFITDVAGNVGATSPVAQVTITDAVVPTITTTTFNAAENGTAVGTVAGTDATAITWSIDGAGADDAQFSITAGGVLSFNAANNYETPDDANTDGVYVVKVKATDASGNVSTQDINVTLTNVNEAPTAVGSIADQFAVLNQNTWSLDLSTSFADVDAGDTKTYSVTTGTLPTGLSLNATTGVISGTPTVDIANTAFTVTMTDSGGLTATQTFNLDVVTAPVLSTTLGGVTNLDVTSKIVLSVGETVTANVGGTITITDLGGTGFHGEATTQTQVINVTDPKVTIVGTGANTKIIIDPTDLDLSSNYSLAVSTGAFHGTTTNQDTVAFTTINFSTVNPGAGTGNTTVNTSAAAASQNMNETTGAMQASFSWLDIQDVGNPSGMNGSTLDMSTGNFALVFKDYTNTAVIGSPDFWLVLSNFANGDLLYVDNENQYTANDPFIPAGDTPAVGQTELSFGTGVGGLGGVVDWNGAVFTTVAELKTLISSTYDPIISA